MNSERGNKMGLFKKPTKPELLGAEIPKPNEETNTLSPTPAPIKPVVEEPKPIAPGSQPEEDYGQYIKEIHDLGHDLLENQKTVFNYLDDRSKRIEDHCVAIKALLLEEKDHRLEIKALLLEQKDERLKQKSKENKK